MNTNVQRRYASLFFVYECCLVLIYSVHNENLYNLRIYPVLFVFISDVHTARFNIYIFFFSFQIHLVNDLKTESPI